MPAEIWKRFHKWDGVPTGATQNPKDLLSSPEIENILENSDFIYLLNLSAGDRKLMTDRLNISLEQLAFLAGKKKELEPLTAVLKAHDREQEEKARAATIHDGAYIISGSSFRVPVEQGVFTERGYLSLFGDERGHEKSWGLEKKAFHPGTVGRCPAGVQLSACPMVVLPLSAPLILRIDLDLCLSHLRRNTF